MGGHEAPRAGGRRRRSSRRVSSRRPRVLLMSENRLEWIYCDFAIQAAGAVTVPIYSGTVPRDGADDRRQLRGGAARSRPTRRWRRSSRSAETLNQHRDDGRRGRGLGPPAAEPNLDEVARGSSRSSPTTCARSSTRQAPPVTRRAPSSRTATLSTRTRAVLKVHPARATPTPRLSWLPFSHVFERINGTFTVLMFGGQTWLSHGVDHLAEDLAAVQPTIMLQRAAGLREDARRGHGTACARRPGYARRSSNGRSTSARDTRTSQAAWPAAQGQHRLADRLVLAALAQAADRRATALLHQRRRRAGARDRGVLLGDRRADPQRMGNDRDVVRRVLQHPRRAPVPDRRQAISRVSS